MLYRALDTRNGTCNLLGTAAEDFDTIAQNAASVHFEAFRDPEILSNSKRMCVLRRFERR